MHLVKAFTQLHIRKIPNVYILKRYTCDVRSFVEWDWNDMPKGGQYGNREDMRFTKLVPGVMGIAGQGQSLIMHVKRLMKRQWISELSSNQYRRT
jgi:hypothetical protein